MAIKTSGFDDQIAVYQASSSGSILSGSSSQYKMIAANDNGSSTDNTAQIANLILEPLTQYWLQLDGNNAAYGNVVIDLISNSLEVYPNPSSGIFNLIVSHPFPGIADVSVYNMQGQKMYVNQKYVTITANQFSIDLSGFAKGIYLLNVTINGSRLSKKLMIM
jgi:hypothetical protein